LCTTRIGSWGGKTEIKERRGDNSRKEGRKESHGGEEARGTACAAVNPIWEGLQNTLGKGQRGEKSASESHTLKKQEGGKGGKKKERKMRGAHSRRGVIKSTAGQPERGKKKFRNERPKKHWKKRKKVKKFHKSRT